MAKNRSALGFPVEAVPRNTGDAGEETTSAVWNGQFVDGTTAPDGQYRLALRVLKLLAPDLDDEDSWNSFITPVFTVAR
jgi:hypothetical protein